jgi:hypothetical protein
MMSDRITPTDEAEFDAITMAAWGDADWRAPAPIIPIVEERERRAVVSQLTTIPYYTPLEIASATPGGTAWVTRGYFAFGAITELDGKIKSSGKTTLLLEAARCMRAGVDFLGQPTTACKVVYVTEQAPGPFPRHSPARGCWATVMTCTSCFDVTPRRCLGPS